VLVAVDVDYLRSRFRIAQHDRHGTAAPVAFCKRHDEAALTRLRIERDQEDRLVREERCHVEVAAAVEGRRRHLVERRLGDPLTRKHRRISQLHLVAALEIGVSAAKARARQKHWVRNRHAAATERSPFRHLG
jgi:hypothetical protein